VDPFPEDQGEDGQIAPIDDGLMGDEPARLTGQQIGPYLLRERLGGGAHSTVYRAVRTDEGENERKAGEVVALKVLLPGADTVARTRFHHEARTAEGLVHPHIVSTMDVGQIADDDVAYIAMELVEGQSLSDLLERHLTLSVLDSCTVLEPITAALAYAHERGIVHRDVKPSNILLRPVKPGAPGSVELSVLDYPVIPLLSDFGIARALDAPELTSVGRTIGTPAYMSPEQCEGGREVDGRADIYSLGAVFYRCLVGRSPYVGATTQILYAHVYHPLTIPDDVLVKLPLHVVNILRRSLAKEPDQRYSSADLMAEDLALIAGRRMTIGPDDAVDTEDATRTMTSLPVPRPLTETSSVLIPAKRETTTRQHALMQARPTQNQGAPEPVTMRESFWSRLSTPWFVMGIVLATLIFIVIVGSRVRNVAPNADNGDQVAQPTTPDMENSGGADDGGGERDGGAQDPVQATPTPVPMPAVDIDSTWEDARFFYQDRDWQDALERLTLILRTDAEFNRLQQTVPPDSVGQLIADHFFNSPDDEFWQQSADLFTADELAVMLFDIYVGLGGEENAANRPALATEYFRQALAVRPGATAVADLLQATLGYINAPPTEKPDARQALHLAHAAYADTLAAVELYCDAAEQTAAALGLISTDALIEQLNNYEALCAEESIRAEEAAEKEVALNELKGSFIYSTYAEDTYAIFTVPAAPGASSSLIVENGRLPDLSSNGRWLAFYSMDPDYQGLSGFDLHAGLSPTDRSARYTRFNEDGEESAASWNPGVNQLVFASRREGDKVERIFVTWADGRDNSQMIGFGGEPSWHPSLDVIVYNGVDETANRPGLWLIRSDGTNARRLTNVRSDIRPQWSPGGQYVVFTSAGRDGNWEIYRLDLTVMTITRMTDNPAQDVLPTIDPEGKNVAFLSDRGGAWAIWVVAIDGGEPQLLTPIAGGGIDWLEHSLQWVP